MGGILVDFHALPEEQLDFVKQCVSDFGLHLVAIRYTPYESVEFDAEQLDEAFAGSSPYDELAFSLKRPRLPARENLELADKNPDLLRLQIGRKSKKGLVESSLSARTDNPAALTVWKKISKRLKDMTEKGVLGVQPETGDTDAYPGHRYTRGAKALEESGVPMLTITGIILKLGLNE